MQKDTSTHFRHFRNRSKGMARFTKCHGLMLIVTTMSILLTLLSNVVQVAVANDVQNAGETTQAQAEKEDMKKKQEAKDEFPEKTWGTYYDPQKVFCGEYDCYKILGFDYETWGNYPPTSKEITQSYRKMSRKWHPDKNKDKGAKDRFVKINKAYEVLTDSKLRKEYDYMRGRPDEYFVKYGSSVIYNYAPKSDTVFVIITLLVLGCAFTWYVQKQRWQQIADRVIKDAVEGLKAHEGGSAESIDARERAEEILKERKTKVSSNGISNNSSASCANGKVKGKAKLTKKELKDMEKEELRPIIMEIVNEIKDFGAGFHQPTWRDLLLVKMIQWPYIILVGILWETKYYIRRVRKMELDEKEREVLTMRAVGNVTWTTASDEDKEEMLNRELWVMSNLEEWQELVEIRQLSAGDQKRYNRWKKKEKKSGKKED